MPSTRPRSCTRRRRRTPSRSAERLSLFISSGNPDPLDQSGEPRVLPYPVPCRVHFEKDEPAGALGERRLEARERLLPFPDLPLQPRQLAPPDAPFLPERLHVH